jgi:hypothetical protein
VVPPPSRSPAAVAAPLTLVVSRPKAVVLKTARPTLALTVVLNRAATLSLALLDRKGHVLARWSKRVRAGNVKLALPIPARARRPGRDTLRIRAGGAARAKVVPVVLR